MDPCLPSQPVSAALGERRARLTAARHPLSRLLLLLPLLFWAGIYVSSIFSPALLDDADSVHAEAAREMLARHDWVTLHADGIRYLEKAPLLYWVIAASFRVFGVSEWAARLPLALGMLGLIFATYSLGRHGYGEEGGFWAALTVSTSLGLYLFTRFQIPDALVGLWLTLGVLVFFRTLEEDPPSRAACWGLAAAAALNVLTKGLIGLVFPAAIILLFLVLTRNLRHLARMRLGSSTLIFLSIAAPWHVLAALRNPSQGHVRGFLWFYFQKMALYECLEGRTDQALIIGIAYDKDVIGIALIKGSVLSTQRNHRMININHIEVREHAADWGALWYAKAFLIAFDLDTLRKDFSYGRERLSQFHRQPWTEPWMRRKLISLNRFGLRDMTKYREPVLWQFTHLNNSL